MPERSSLRALSTKLRGFSLRSATGRMVEFCDGRGRVLFAVHEYDLFDADGMRFENDLPT